MAHAASINRKEIRGKCPVKGMHTIKMRVDKSYPYCKLYIRSKLQYRTSHWTCLRVCEISMTRQQQQRYNGQMRDKWLLLARDRYIWDPRMFCRKKEVFREGISRVAIGSLVPVIGSGSTPACMLSVR